MATLSERAEFLDLVLADEELLRAEFAAIVEGFDDDPPPPTRPVRRGPSPCRPQRAPGRAPGPGTHRPFLPERARERSPPLEDREDNRKPGRSPTTDTADEPNAHRGTDSANRPAVRNEVVLVDRGHLVVSLEPRMTDPHRVLGVPADATQEEITSAYHRLVRRYHPDTTEESTADRFREVVAAYTTLRARQPDERTPAPQPRPRRTEPTQDEPAIRVGPVRYHGPPRGHR
jgi:DnaJ-domain-containing protein 1